MEQGARNEGEIKRLSSALGMSEETQAKMEECIGKMEQQMAALVETALSSQSQINATYANALRGAPLTPANSSQSSITAVPMRTNHATAHTVQIAIPAIKLALTNANVGIVNPSRAAAPGARKVRDLQRKSIAAESQGTREIRSGCAFSSGRKRTRSSSGRTPDGWRRPSEGQGSGAPVAPG